MATQTWKSATSGIWGVVGNWNSTAPLSTDTAVLPTLSGAAYTVTIAPNRGTAPVTVGSVSITGANVTLLLNNSADPFTVNGAFAITSGANFLDTGLLSLATLGGGIAAGSAGTITVAAGADLVFGSNSLSAAATVTFSGVGVGDGVFFNTTAPGGVTISTAFTQFAKTDYLAFLGNVSSESYSGSTLTVATSQGTYTFNNFGFSAATPDRTFVNSTLTVGGVNYNVITLVCFATGTRIRTERGEVAVEDIAAGDRVVTLEDDTEVLRAVTWVGNRRLDIAAHARPELAAPVRIRASAFGEGLPQRDLLLSPDHCLFVDGKLVPAKLLVNDMTIVNEPATGTVTYYHVELERHAVLLAEGLPAESYLDTGNRAFFPDSGLATVLHPEFHVNAGHHGWDDACAPLASDPVEVEALWHRLAARAEALGHVRPAIQTTTDADLHVMAGGKAIRPVAVSAGRHVFVLPAGTTSIRLESRYAIPADLAPYSDDRRRLGVAIGRITVRSDAGDVEIAADHPMLRRGWHPPERAGAKLWRWTDGDADLPLASTAGAVMVEVQVQSTATYRLREAAVQPRRLAA